MSQSVNGPGVTPKDKEKQKETKVDVRGRPLTVGRMSCTKRDWHMDRASTKANYRRSSNPHVLWQGHPTKELWHWLIPMQTYCLKFQNGINWLNITSSTTKTLTLSYVLYLLSLATRRGKPGIVHQTKYGDTKRSQMLITSTRRSPKHVGSSGSC